MRQTVSVSVGGYAAGPAQSLDNPMGMGGMALHGAHVEILKL